MTPVRLLFFSCSLWFVLFGGVFFLLYPHFLPRVFSILSGFACVLCFIWIYLDFWIFRSQIPISPLANPSIHPLSPLQFAHEPYFSLLAEQCNKCFSFLSNSRILFMRWRGWWGFLVFSERKKYGGCCPFFPLRYWILFPIFRLGLVQFFFPWGSCIYQYLDPPPSICHPLRANTNVDVDTPDRMIRILYL